MSWRAIIASRPASFRKYNPKKKEIQAIDTDAYAHKFKNLKRDSFEVS